MAFAVNVWLLTLLLPALNHNSTYEKMNDSCTTSSLQHWQDTMQCILDTYLIILAFWSALTVNTYDQFEDRCIDDIVFYIFLFSLLYKTNRFHFAVHLFESVTDHRWCKNMSDTLGWPSPFCTPFRQKRYPFHLAFMEKSIPFTHLPKNTASLF